MPRKKGSVLRRKIARTSTSRRNNGTQRTQIDEYRCLFSDLACLFILENAADERRYTRT